MQIDALQEVLEKLRSKEMPLEKKHGWLPSVSRQMRNKTARNLLDFIFLFKILWIYNSQKKMRIFRRLFLSNQDF